MNLQKEFLGENLTQTERLYLGSLTHHDGWPVLEKMMQEACRIANEDVMKLDPEDKEYIPKLTARQQRARNISEFCGAIIKSIKGNIQVAEDNERKTNERPNPGTETN
jgi:hypothetical protein